MNGDRAKNFRVESGLNFLYETKTHFVPLRHTSLIGLPLPSLHEETLEKGSLLVRAESIA